MDNEGLESGRQSRKLLIPQAERWPSGRRHQIANLAYWVTGTEGSNPSLSATQSSRSEILRSVRRKPAYIGPICSLAAPKTGEFEPHRGDFGILSLFRISLVPREKTATNLAAAPAPDPAGQSPSARWGQSIFLKRKSLALSKMQKSKRPCGHQIVVSMEIGSLPVISLYFSGLDRASASRSTQASV